MQCGPQTATTSFPPPSNSADASNGRGNAQCRLRRGSSSREEVISHSGFPNRRGAGRNLHQPVRVLGLRELPLGTGPTGHSRSAPVEERTRLGGTRQPDVNKIRPRGRQSLDKDVPKGGTFLRQSRATSALHQLPTSRGRPERGRGRTVPTGIDPRRLETGSDPFSGGSSSFQRPPRCGSFRQRAKHAAGPVLQ